MQISFYLFFSVWAEGQLIRLQGEISGGDPREPFLCSPFRRRGERLGFPKDSGVSLHPIPVECRNKTPSPWHKEKMSVPWSALHPPPLYIPRCLPQPARCAPKYRGKCPQILHPCFPRSPHGPLQAHGVHAGMGRKVIHPMDGGQSWAGVSPRMEQTPTSSIWSAIFWQKIQFCYSPAWAPNVVISARLIFIQFNKGILYFIF